jgi:hypothetical protein
LEASWERGLPQHSGTVLFPDCSAAVCAIQRHESQVFILLIKSCHASRDNTAGVFSTAKGQLVEGVTYTQVLTLGEYACFLPDRACGWADVLHQLFVVHVRKYARVLAEQQGGGGRTGTPPSYHSSGSEPTSTAGTPDSSRKSASFSFTQQEPLTWMKLHRIGRGAFGDVFQCLNTTDGSCFATKQVPTGTRNGAFPIYVCQTSLSINYDKASTDWP